MLRPQPRRGSGTDCRYLGQFRLRGRLVRRLYAAYTLAARASCGDPEACELVATASIPPAAEAIARASFRFHHAQPVFVLDSRKLFAASQSLNVTFLESDLAYGLDPKYPYLT